MSAVNHRLTLTVPELASVLGVSAQSLYNHIDREHDVIKLGSADLAIVRLGERVCIPKANVSKHLGMTLDALDKFFADELVAS